MVEAALELGTPIWERILLKARVLLKPVVGIKVEANTRGEQITFKKE